MWPLLKIWGKTDLTRNRKVTLLSLLRSSRLTKLACKVTSLCSVYRSFVSPPSGGLLSPSSSNTDVGLRKTYARLCNDCVTILSMQVRDLRLEALPA